MALRHTTSNDSDHRISIAHGKQGRHDPAAPLADLLEVTDTVDANVDTLPESAIESIAATVRALAETHQGHRFDAEYMAEHDGAYGISTVFIDTQLNATHLLTPLFRPTSPGGHVFFRTKKMVSTVIERTHDDVPLAQAGSNDIYVCAGKFTGLECIVVIPDSLMHHPHLIRALDLDGFDGARPCLASLRVCDGNGLGRSAPRVCCGKFKLLFPNAPMDTSLVASRKRPSKKRRADDNDPPPAAASVRAINVKDSLNAMLKAQYDMHPDTKGLLCCVAKNFIESLGFELDEATFNTKLGGFVALDPDVAVMLLGTIDMCHSIATSALNDARKVAHVMKTVTAHRDLLRDSMIHARRNTQ